MPLSNYATCWINEPGCNCRVTGVEVDRPISQVIRDEAYTYSAEQIRGLTEWLPAPSRDVDDGYMTGVRSWVNSTAPAWNGVFNVQDRFTPAAILKEPYRTVGGVKQRDWNVAWNKMWRQVGAAHEAKIFCKEVTYKDGELLIR